ncbi:MAG: sensor histidine kinase [Phycisphaerae bacterium]
MEPKQKGWLTARRAATIFWVASLVFTGVQCLAYYHQWQREEENRRQEASQRLVVDLRTLLARLEIAESDERGYVITGEEGALGAYQRAETELRAALDAVKREGAATGELGGASLDPLERRASREMEELEKTVELRRRAGFDAAAAEVASGRAQQLMADARRAIQGLQAREEAALLKHTVEEARRIRENVWMFGAVTAADVLLLGLGYWGMHRYVTDRRRTEASLAAAWKTAEAANVAKDRVLHTVSHDLRTPLNGVMLWAEILKRGDPKNAEAAEAIRQYVEAQTRLVNDLLDASRMERGAMRVEKKEVVLEEAVSSAVEALRPQAEERRVRLEVDLQLEGVHVVGDGFRLQQVFWNLMSNAIKFTPPEGEVRVSGRVEGMAAVEVRDTGRGIRREFLPRVFEAYSQEEGAGKQGLGLGLAIVKHLVEAHGGTVEARSEGEGKGAAFVVRVPVMGGEGRREVEEMSGARV